MQPFSFLLALGRANHRRKVQGSERNNNLLGTALANIQKKKGRSVLAIVASALGMGFLLVMMAFGTGGASACSSDPLQGTTQRKFV